MVIWVKTELMVEICSKSLVRAIGKVLPINNQLKPIKVSKNGLVNCKQKAVLVVCINNIGQ